MLCSNEGGHRLTDVTQCVFLTDMTQCVFLTDMTQCIFLTDETLGRCSPTDIFHLHLKGDKKPS